MRKGQTLDAASAALALAAPWDEIHVLELEPGDIHEEPAGSRIAQAVAGAGVEVKRLHGRAVDPRGDAAWPGARA